MPQTILALAAILSFAYLAMGRQQHDQSVDRHTQGVEAELAAVDVARARMTAMERLAFDEADTGRRGVRTQPSDLALGADDDETGPGTYDDVDDWNAEPPSIEAVPVGLDSLRFRVEVAVRYVRDLEPTRASAKATLTKEIVVSAVEIPAGDIGRVPAEATLTRVVTPASVASYLQ
ncbi:hypothetical protein [Rubrivirga sp. IMCC43871]|uniref:hypothetical protein n=1 Tax=Rubrivirga sp. IMCC43871 TaxID=3391575 RepID=UPI00398FEE75